MTHGSWCLMMLFGLCGWYGLRIDGLTEKGAHDYGSWVTFFKTAAHLAFSFMALSGLVALIAALFGMVK